MKTFCMICKKREATVLESAFMKKYMDEPGRSGEYWRRVRYDIPIHCDPCDKRLWSS